LEIGDLTDGPLFSGRPENIKGQTREIEIKKIKTPKT